MAAIQLKYERELLLAMKQEDVGRSLKFIVVKSRIGSSIVDPFASPGVNTKAKLEMDNSD